MTKRSRGTRRRRGQDDTGATGAASAAGEGSGDFVGQIGLFETANGMPHGPVAIVLAVLAAILVLPVVRFVRYITRR